MKNERNLIKEIKNAAKVGDVANVQKHIAALSTTSGLDINEKDSVDHTALTLAADNGQIEVVKILLKNGAKIDHKTKAKHTALTLAANKGFVTVVKLLITWGKY